MFYFIHFGIFHFQLFFRFSQPTGYPEMSFNRFKEHFKSFLENETIYSLRQELTTENSDYLSFDAFEYIDIDLNQELVDKYYDDWSKVPFKDTMKPGGYKHLLEEQGASKYKVISWEEQVNSGLPV